MPSRHPPNPLKRLAWLLLVDISFDGRVLQSLGEQATSSVRRRAVEDEADLELFSI